MIISILLVASQAMGQYIDTVCAGTAARGYHVFGSPGSTFSWNVQGGTASPLTTNDTIFINWGNIPGVYSLSVTEINAQGCSGTTMLGRVWVTGIPYVYAGPKTTVCASGTVNLSQADSTWCSSVHWTTSGDGSFSNANALNPVYTPGPVDFASGFTVLTISGTGFGVCPPVSSSLTVRLSNMLVSVQTTDVTCYGYNDGNAQISLTGAIAPVSYLWNPGGMTTSFVSGLAPGTYSVMITDSAMCPVLQNVTINQQHPTPSATLGMVTPLQVCKGDTVKMRFDLTGTPPFNLTYTDGFTQTTIPGIMSSPYWVNTFPTQSCTYSIVGMTDAYCTAMPSMISGSAAITVFQLPNAEFTWEPGEQNYEIDFHLDTITTNLGGIGYMYKWDFGDGTFGYDHNPVHIYPTYYQYTVKLTVTDTNGCTNSVTHLVDVAPVPWAFFSSTSPQCLGNDICFTDLSHTSPEPFSYITTWIWNYGDGTYDTIYFPAMPHTCHHYDNLSTYNVTLKIIDNHGSYDSYTSSVNLLQKPVADFTGRGDCAGEYVTFTNNSSENGSVAISSYQWNFGDPLSGTQNTSSLEHPTHIFTTGGKYYTVTLVTTNYNNCTDTSVQNIWIRPAPAAEFSFSAPCLNTPVTFMADTAAMQTDSLVAWLWNFGDGTTTSSQFLSATHTYTVTGSFVATLTVTDIHGCSNTVSDTVNITLSPVAGFSWNTPICGKDPVHFTDNSYAPAGYITEWHWDFGDGTDSTIYHPQIPDVIHAFVPGSDIHTVTLTVKTNTGCVSVISHQLHTLPTPVADFKHDAITCPGQSVGFYDISAVPGGSSIASWSWNFDDPLSGTSNFSTLQNPVHSFTAPGNYNVSLIVRNINECPDTIVKSITINIPPVAMFSAEKACQANPVIFNDLSVPNSGNLITWFWDFGDGTTSAVQEPSHVYSLPGTYPVSLTVTNSSGCKHDTTIPVTVLPLPVAAFSNSAENCAGSEVYFTDESHIVGGYQGSILKWTWDFGDGSPLQTISFPASPNISHIYPVAGIFNATLTLKTTDSCIASVTHPVKITAKPVAAFNYPAENCSSKQVQFTDASNPAGSVISHYFWNFGDPLTGTANNSTLQNPAHIFSASGTYNVTLIIVNVSGCSDTIINQVPVLADPVADFSANSSCAGNPVTFYNSSISGGLAQSYWEFGDGAVSTSFSPVHTYSNAGTYNVKLTVTTYSGCTADTIKAITILPVPVAEFTGNTGGCKNDTLHFTDVTAGGNVMERSWDFGDGIVTATNAVSVCHSYQNPGNYIVTLTVTTSEGCSSSRSVPVHIYAEPLPDFTYSATQCQGTPVQFNGTSSGAQAAQWNWNFGDPSSGSSNISTLQNPVHVFSGSGNFNVTLSVISVNGCSGETVGNIQIYQKPVAQFSDTEGCTGSPVLFTDNSTTSSGNIISWQWNFGDPSSGTLNTSTLQDPHHLYANAGTYMVHLTVRNSNNCQDDTIIPVTVQPGPTALFQYSASCIGTGTSFTDLSAGGMISSWFWDFGDGNGTSTLQNPVYTYTSAGTFNVKLRITNSNGCPDSVIMPVVSHQAPVAAFSYNSVYCPAGQVFFQDASSASGTGISERLWIFENGSTSTVPNPVHVFPVTDTVYHVSLIITDNRGCKDTISMNVNVKKSFSFSAVYDSVCYGDGSSFHLVNNTPGDSLWFTQWNFGDPASGNNNFSTSTDPVHTFTHPGNFTVRVKVTNSDNCHDSIYKTVPVYARPQANFEYNAPSCETNVLFTDLSVAATGDITERKWDFGDGSGPVVITNSGFNPEHNYQHPGKYLVTLEVKNSKGCSSVLTKEVYRTACLDAQIEPSGQLYCQNSPVTFNDNSIPLDHIKNWRWSFGDGIDTAYTSYAGTITHTYSQPGNYTVHLFINSGSDDDFFRDSTSRTITVIWSPQADFETPVTCLNSESRFNDLSAYPQGATLQRIWNFGDPSSGNSNSSSLQNPSHSYNHTGKFNVKLFLKNQYGCKDSLKKQVRVMNAPVADFEANSACSGHPVLFNDLSSSDTVISSWHWNFGVPGTRKDTAVISDPLYSFKEKGNYDVKLVVKDRIGCTDTAVKGIEILQSPLSAFIVDEEVTDQPGKIRLINQSQGASGFVWNFGNGESSFEENPVVTFKDDGNYMISLITSGGNGCFDTVYLKYEFLFHSLFIPNAFAPTSETYGVRYFRPAGMNLKDYKIEIFNEWGNLIWSSTALDNQGRPVEAWDGRDKHGDICTQGTYLWKISATFSDGHIWQGSDIGKGLPAPVGTVTLIR